MEITSQLEDEIKLLQERVRGLDASEFLPHIASRLVFRGESFFKAEGLSSPMKQYFYLAGLFCSTDPSGEVAGYSELTWEELKQSLQRIYGLLPLMFWPSQEELASGLTEAWRSARQVMMPYYIHYFNTVDLSYDEQVLERLDKLFTPYSDVLQASLGFDVADIIKVYNKVIEVHKKKVARAARIEEAEAKARTDFLNRVRVLNLDPLQAEAYAKADPWGILMDSLEAAEVDMRIVTTGQLQEALPSHTLERFLAVFALERTGRPFFYPTEANPVTVLPSYGLAQTG